MILNQALDITSLTFTNVPTDGGCVLTIFRVKDNTGTARAISGYDAAITWIGGTPTLSQAANGVTAITLVGDGAGTLYGTSLS